MGETLQATGGKCESWGGRGRREPWCKGGSPRASSKRARDGARAGVEKGLGGVESYEEAAWSRAGIGALCRRGSHWEWSERRGFKGKSPLGTGKLPNSRAWVKA